MARISGSRMLKTRMLRSQSEEWMYQICFVQLNMVSMTVKGALINCGVKLSAGEEFGPPAFGRRGTFCVTYTLITREVIGFQFADLIGLALNPTLIISPHTSKQHFKFNSLHLFEIKVTISFLAHFANVYF